jgi:hypothetical protein
MKHIIKHVFSFPLKFIIKCPKPCQTERDFDNSYLSNKKCKDLITFEVAMYYGGQKILNDQILAYQEMSM